MAEPKAQQQPEYTMPNEGFRYVYNRTSDPYEGMFDCRPIRFEAHEVKLLTTERADHLYAHSLINGTLKRVQGGELKGEKALALGPGWRIKQFNKQGEADHFGNNVYTPEYEEAPADAEFLVPTETKPGVELFDKSLPNYVDRPSRDGQPTKRMAVAV